MRMCPTCRCPNELYILAHSAAPSYACQHSASCEVLVLPT